MTLFLLAILSPNVLTTKHYSGQNMHHVKLLQLKIFVDRKKLVNYLKEVFDNAFEDYDEDRLYQVIEYTPDENGFTDVPYSNNEFVMVNEMTNFEFIRFLKEEALNFTKESV